MRICIPRLEGRVSPVLDVAKTLLVIDSDSGAEIRRFEACSSEVEPLSKARRIIDLAPQLVICGAVSHELEAALRSAGIELSPNICGAVEEVIAAFFSGELVDARFLMPGCCGQRRRIRRGWGSRREGPSPSSRGSGGSGARRRGQGRSRVCGPRQDRRR